MEFLSRLTPFEELVWEMVEGALALGERISLQASRATGDAAAGACEALFSPLCESAPLSQSSPLSSSQDVEVLASSALSQEQHTCEATLETQGPEHTQDISSGLVPESSFLAFGLACCASQSPASSSSQDGDLAFARSPPLLTHTSSSGEAYLMQGPEQTQDGSDKSVPALEKDELLFPQLLASAELPTQLCERGLCGATEGALPAGGERVSEEEEGAGSGRSQSLVLAEPSGGACHFERLDRGLHILDVTPAVCLDDTFMRHVAQLAPLENLHIQGCDGLTETGLVAVLRGCPALRTLILEQCGGLCGRAFEGIPCRLEELALEFCGGTTNEALFWVAEACPGLVTLSVKTGSKDASLGVGLEMLAQRCKGLTKLVLHACGVTDETLLAFAVGCPGLSSLELHCEPAITDGGLAAVTSCLYQLQHLVLFNNRKLFQIPRSGPGLKLKTLSLGWFWYTPDLLLRQVTEEESLETLQIYGCSFLKDATVERVLAKCSHLKVLGFAFDELLTPGLLEAYARCSRKVFLEIKKCKGIDAGGLSEQLRNLSNVEVDKDTN
ncbi:hypothetical protein KFL_002850160 [Klebsormidium nitens]|uniref:Leucine rich repeat/RNI-like superfamily protein n=1 Tax=Klebsormidium nitens TaxID=105231 RepID=A0A1Y1I8V0_KLENI|nr:hypothetical protein KFL_002850160 [Klebsormidium nitens]|eukprot:GAQ86372.1 hypothetical protein KFL_002850160 [Klebsormidium nitens]